jgi:site-specific DNA-methyltransferase (adenine-specific)
MNILTENYKLYLGDCLEVMDKLIEQGVVVDAIICDPPYGTTHCKWDSVIPFDKMWERLNKLIKPNGAICLFSVEPFGSLLRVSNIKNYRYDWQWFKSKSGNFLQANKQPHKRVEYINVFYRKRPTYNPLKIKNPKGVETRNKYKISKQKDTFIGQVSTTKEYSEYSADYEADKLLPISLLEFKNVQNPIHPTQKPVDLLEYLIKTYTNEGELVLDFTMGSGSTGVACINTNRKFIGIELDENYFNISINRIFENYNN